MEAACQAVAVGDAGRLSAMSRLRVALCQLDTDRRRCRGQRRAGIIDCLARAEDDGADVAAFPELAVTGYPPEDLLLKPAFVADNLAALATVAQADRRVRGDRGLRRRGLITTTWVTPCRTRRAPAWWRAKAPSEPSPAACATRSALCVGGRVVGVYHKRRLPNYGVFDEERWFAPGTSPSRAVRDRRRHGGRVDLRGPLVCRRAGRRARQPAVHRLVVNVNASPYSIGRGADRLAVARARVAEAGCAIAYVNQVGRTGRARLRRWLVRHGPVGRRGGRRPGVSRDGAHGGRGGAPSLGVDGTPAGAVR